jgi:hypothetical protein
LGIYFGEQISTFHSVIRSFDFESLRILVIHGYTHTHTFSKDLSVEGEDQILSDLVNLDHIKLFVHGTQATKNGVEMSQVFLHLDLDKSKLHVLINNCLLESNFLFSSHLSHI